jgi:predicted transcriptional regulator
MGHQTSITAQVSGETLDLVDRLALARGLSREAYAAEAIRQVSTKEAEFLAFVQVGVDAADRGDVVSQDEVEAWLDERIAASRDRATRG